MREPILRIIFGIFAFLFCHLTNGINVTDDGCFRIVVTEGGLVRGKKMTTIFDAVPYYSFRGIPYAKPPLKELRFKPPQKAHSWPGIKDVFNYGNECVQPVMINSEWKGHEDCLTINIFVPAAIAPDAKLPVMFYIHWGAYFSGSANIFGPDFLVGEDVILVTFNYRLGPFGFLSLATPEYSGNMGLKDQLLALKWVNKNIENFGGDREQITIFGYSAGSAGANYHIISPSSKGLFKRAILSGGSVLNPWAYTEKSQWSILYNFAAQIFYPVDTPEEMIKLLQTVDAELFSKSTFQNLIVPGMTRRVPDFTWSPVVEHPDTIEPFLNRTPIDILLDDRYSDDIDVLVGHSSDEIYILMIKDMIKPRTWQDDEQVDIGLPMKSAEIDFRSKEYQEIEKRFRRHYFKNGLTSSANHSDTLKELNELLTDVYFTYGIDLFAKIHANMSTGRTYFYIFSADTSLNLFKRFSTARMYGLKGATHGDEVLYVFRLNGQIPYVDVIYTSLKEDSLERALIRNMTKLYTNFAKYGNPAPNADPVGFKQFETDNLNYVEITNDGLISKTNPNGDDINFWNSIFSDYSHLWQQAKHTEQPQNTFVMQTLMLPIGIGLSLAAGAVFFKFCRIICLTTPKALV